MSSSQPTPIDPAVTYQRNISADLKNAPKIAKANYKLQAQYQPLLLQQQIDMAKKSAPEFADIAFGIQSKYAPKYRELQDAEDRANAFRELDIEKAYGPEWTKRSNQQLKDIDPKGVEGRNRLYRVMNEDLHGAGGYNLRPELVKELNEDIRGAQAARGNILGNAPIAAESLYTGKAREAMRQGRINNMMQLLSDSPEVDFYHAYRNNQPMRSRAGAGMAQVPMYQPMDVGAPTQYVRQPQANFGAPKQRVKSNPWLSALGGAASGALGGAIAGSTVPGIGTVAGGVAGGLIGGFGGYASAPGDTYI